MADGAMLKDWAIMHKNGVFAVDVSEPLYLVGVIHDDDRFSDGTVVKTSLVKTINNELSEAQTRNTRYRLGQPDKSFMGRLKEKGVDLDVFKLYGANGGISPANNPRLDDWYVMPSGDNIYLMGKIYDDKRQPVPFPDGTEIHTSIVSTIDDGLKQVQTSNTLYRLGSPHVLFNEADKYRGYDKKNT